MKNFPTLKKIFQPFLKTDLPKKINLSVKNQTRCNTPLLLGFNGKIKLSVFSKKSPFSSSLIFRKSQNFRRLKYSKIKGFYLKNQTVCYNQTGRLNTFKLKNYTQITHKIFALKKRVLNPLIMAGTTRLELATSCVTGMRSNQTELRSLIKLSVPFDLLRD